MDRLARNVHFVSGLMESGVDFVAADIPRLANNRLSSVSITKGQMKKPAIFISSICYDLRQIRADLLQFVESMGLDPALSEYDSFPVQSDLGTVDNCTKLVQEKADIFVLIVAKRFGSTNKHGKSITNLEFLTARHKGIPLYAFVDRDVMSFLQLWEKNPTIDFRPIVHDSRLFESAHCLHQGGAV